MLSSIFTNATGKLVLVARLIRHFPIRNPLNEFPINCLVVEIKKNPNYEFSTSKNNKIKKSSITIDSMVEDGTTINRERLDIRCKDARNQCVTRLPPPTKEKRTSLVGLRVSRGLVVAKQAGSRWLLDLSSSSFSLSLFFLFARPRKGERDRHNVTAVPGFHSSSGHVSFI